MWVSSGNAALCSVASFLEFLESQVYSSFSVAIYKIMHWFGYLIIKVVVSFDDLEVWSYTRIVYLQQRPLQI